MRSYQLLKRKKSERLLKMGEEKWPLQVREQRGLCFQCLAKSPIYWSERVAEGGEGWIRKKSGQKPLLGKGARGPSPGRDVPDSRAWRESSRGQP